MKEDWDMVSFSSNEHYNSECNSEHSKAGSGSGHGLDKIESQRRSNDELSSPKSLTMWSSELKFSPGLKCSPGYIIWTALVVIVIYLYIGKHIQTNEDKYTLSPYMPKYQNMTFPEDKLDKDNPRHVMAISIHNEIVSVQNEYLHHLRSIRFTKGSKDHSDGTCLIHDAGLVQNPDKESPTWRREYCFGSSTISGKRFCPNESLVKDYMSIDAQLNSGVVKLYHSSFGYHPMFHKSAFTQEYLRQKSTDPTPKQDYTIMITTQGSWNRLEHIQDLVQSWQGPVSFSLLLDNYNQKEDLLSMIKETPLLKQFVDIHIVWRIDNDKGSDTDRFYPINFLRNVALQASVAPWVFMIDADVKPNSVMKSMSRWIYIANEEVERQPGHKQDCPGLNAFVLPTVEMGPNDYQKLKSKSVDNVISKGQVVDSLLQGHAQPMHLYFSPAYLPTNHFEWMFNDGLIEIPYLTRFEPYYIARRSLPYFDESFINRGGNYAEQVYEMAAGGYRFFRLPFAFTIDIPHSKISANQNAETSTEHNEKDENTSLDETDIIITNSDEKMSRTIVKALSSKGSIAAFENETKQNIHNENFTSVLWENLSQRVRNYYKTGTGETFIGSRPTRCYRHNIGHFAEQLWGLFNGDSVPEKVPKRFIDRPCYKI
eukprot:CFRG5585T1